METFQSLGNTARQDASAQKWGSYFCARPLIVGARSTLPPTLNVQGDFEDTGKWTLAQDGERVDVGFLWRVRVKKSLPRYLPWLQEPVITANHRRAIAVVENRRVGIGPAQKTVSNADGGGRLGNPGRLHLIHSIAEE